MLDVLSRLEHFFCFHFQLMLSNCPQVEDKRLELEKKYVSLHARHEGMVKVHNMTKQHLQRLKVNIKYLIVAKCLL